MKNLKLETLKKIDEEDMKTLYNVMNKFTEKERLIFCQYFISGLDNELTPLENIEKKLNGIFPASTIYNFLTEEYEPFQELLIKDLFYNEANNIIIHSWELVNPDVVLKTLDRSAFLYNSTSVAMGVRSYFDGNLGRNERKEIKFIYKDKEYYAEFALDNLENPRSSIRWNNDFGDLIKEILPEYYSLFKDEKNRDNILLPKIKFQKEKEDIYLIDFII